MPMADIQTRIATLARMTTDITTRTKNMTWKNITIMTIMTIPTEVRREATRYAGGNPQLTSAFIRGWLFAHPEYLQGDYQLDPGVPITMDSVIDKWLEYKKERRQSYKARGLEALKKKLYEYSCGNPIVANEIVEYSMANNYQGIFPLRNNIKINEQQSNIVDKVADILAD